MDTQKVNSEIDEVKNLLAGSHSNTLLAQPTGFESNNTLKRASSTNGKQTVGLKRLSKLPIEDLKTPGKISAPKFN